MASLTNCKAGGAGLPKAPGAPRPAGESWVLGRKTQPAGLYSVGAGWRVMHWSLLSSGKI